jgi:site-specific recombinase XerD
MKLDSSLELYLKYLRYEKNLTPNSIRSYTRDIVQFHNFLKNIKKINDISQLDLAVFRKFLKSIDQNNYANRTILRKYSSFVNYFRFLEENNLIDIQLSQFINVPRKRERLYTFLSKNEMERLFDSMSAEDDLNNGENNITPENRKTLISLNKRNRLIVELIYSTGTRVSEVENIKISDIDSEKREIKVTGKGRKQRIVYINSKCQYLLELYLKESRPELSLNYKTGMHSGDLHLLLNSKGGRLSSRSIREIVRRAVLQAGIKKKITPHSIRHSFASHLMHQGAGIREIQELLGHENISTTEIYSHLDIKKIKDDYRRFHPRAN